MKPIVAAALPEAPAMPLTSGRGWRRAWQRHFGGLTRQGFALILVLCALNALRRKVQAHPDDVNVAAWLAQFALMLGLGLVVALPVALAAVWTYDHAPRRPWQRYPALAAAVVLSSIAGVAAMAAIETASGHPLQYAGGGPVEVALEFVRSYWLRYGALAALFTAVYVYARTADESAARARDAELDRRRFEQQMEEARLAVLQAQIEPHFLFNTLATVRSLYRESPADAAGMLDNLMRYLSVALPQMRAGDTTLGREAALADAYLAIQKLRMGRRLAFEIDVPAALHEAAVPPMMLLTLVENAIKHGLAPLPEGGFLRVQAHAADGRLAIEVSDTGRGFAHTSGAGTGLANIRARLEALHGRSARLDIGLNRPRGVTAALVLPLAKHPAGAAE